MENHIKLTDMTVAKTWTIHAAAMNIVKVWIFLFIVYMHNRVSAYGLYVSLHTHLYSVHISWKWFELGSPNSVPMMMLRHSGQELKRCVDKLSKSTYPSLAPITVFVISGLQSVIYWKNFCHVWWVSYGLYVINCICTLMRAVFWLTYTFSGYINRLCRHSVESYCVSWIYCLIIC